MKIRRFLASGIMAVWASAAGSEVTVSITIEGDAEDLISVLRLLQDKQLIGGEDQTPLRIDLHSLLSEEEVAAAAPHFSELSVEPARVSPGATTLVRVHLADEGGVVDTVAGQVGEAGQLQFDLYDDGTHGDEQADDGVWSYALEVPETAALARYTLSVKAYDENGDEVWVEGEDETRAALKAETALMVTQE